MTSFSGTTSCCTALLMWDLDDLDDQDDIDLLDWLKNDLPSGLRNQIGGRAEATWNEANGFALIYGITTAEQNSDKSMAKLGFQQVYVAEKTHESSREKPSGALKMWCVQPWVLNEKRLAWIAELEKGVSDEEIARRQTFPEFRLHFCQKSDIWKEHNNGNKIYTKDAFPENRIVRNALFAFIKEITGGYDIANDREVLGKLRERILTWGFVKDRAIQWRNGDF